MDWQHSENQPQISTTAVSETTVVPSLGVQNSNLGGEGHLVRLLNGGAFNAHLPSLGPLFRRLLERSRADFPRQDQRPAGPIHTLSPLPHGVVLIAQLPNY